MKAMILAAGRGERMRPLTDRTPKPLLEVHGQPLIVHHLRALAAGGFRDIVINLSWLGERIRRRLGNGSEFGVRIAYSVEETALETAGGIVAALPLLGERFVVVNGDIRTDYDFSRLRAAAAGADAYLVLVDNPAQHADGDFTLVGDAIANDGAPRYTFAGIAAYRREFFAGLPAGKRALAPLLRRAADEGRLGGEYFRGYWHDIGTPARLEEINARRAPAQR